jgi:hypothetical protein
LIVKSLKSQLTLLELADLRYTNANEMVSMWKAIGYCIELKSFSFFLEKNRRAQITPEMVKTALFGKSIDMLRLKVTCIKTDDIAEIISSFPSRSLRHISTDSLSFSLSNFSLKHWFLLQQIDFIFIGQLLSTDLDWLIILRLPRLCTQLMTLKLFYSGPTSDSDLVEMAINLIMSYLAVLNESVGQRSPEFELDIYKLGSFQKTPACGEKIFNCLTEDHQCTIATDQSDNIVIRLGEQSLCSIKLIKNDLSFF